MTTPAPASTDPWTIRRVLDWTRGHFEKQQVDSARLTAELLLAFTLKTERVKLYMDLDRPLDKDELANFRALIQRRLGGEPTQYLLGEKHFYNHVFRVDSRVLIPRPETELLVEAVLREVPKDAPCRVLDLCTGSGCIAVSIAAERPQASVWATDLSEPALEVARANAEALGADGRVTFFSGDLFAPLPAGAKFDVIVSNPPYIRTSELAELQREVQKEPRQALDGGEDGLVLLTRIAEAALTWLKPGGLLALEIGDEQADAMKALLTRVGGHDVRVDKDFARHDRLAFMRSPKALE